MKNLGLILISIVAVAIVGCSNPQEQALHDASMQAPDPKKIITPDKLAPKPGEAPIMGAKRVLGRLGGMR